MPESRPDEVAWLVRPYRQDPTLTYLLASAEGPATRLVVFLGGLTDSPGSVAWSHELTRWALEARIGVLVPTLPSALGGWAMSSLDEDVRNIRLAIDAYVGHEREHGRLADGAVTEVVLVGHSTGCQDIMHFLSPSADRWEEPGGWKVVGGILQAPVSDREDWEGRRTAQEEKMAALAQDMCSQGRAHELLPERAMPKDVKVTPEESHAIIYPPFSAYRYKSLYLPDGDDDYFSSDRIDRSKAFIKAASGRAPLCFISSGDDGYVPKHVDVTAMHEQWEAGSSADGRVETHIIAGADHKCSGDEQRDALVQICAKFIERVFASLNP